MKKRILAFLMSFVMILGCMNFVYAENVNNKIYIGEDKIISDSSIEINSVSSYSNAFSANNATESKRQDIILVLDDSGSMSSNDMDALKEASVKFCETVFKANSANRVGVYAFSRKIKCDLTDDISELTKVIDNLYSSNSTPLHTGIATADSMFEDLWDDDTIKSMVIMSDGEPDSSSKAKSAYDNIADKYKVYSVYFGNSSSASSFMESIQNSGFYNATDVDSLIENFGKIADKILNPLNLELRHECTYDFFTQEYTIELVVANPNDEAVHNVYAEINLPEGVDFKSNTAQNQKIYLSEIKANSDSSHTVMGESDDMVVLYNPFVWYTEIFQTSEDKSYTISVDVYCDEFSTLSIEDTIYINGYGTNNKQLNISEDTWNFVNYSEKPIRVNNSAMDGIYSSIRDANIKQSMRDYIEEGSNGHCYGMSSTVVLKKANAKVLENFDVIHDIPFDNTEARETIGYYQVSQILPEIVNNNTNINSLGEVEKLEYIANRVNLCKTGANPLLIVFDLALGAHAVVAYSYTPNYEFTYAGYTYNSVISLYDCNYPNQNAFILFNSFLNSNNQVEAENSQFKYIVLKNDEYIEPYSYISFRGANNDINLIDFKNISNMEKYNNAILKLKVGKSKINIEENGNTVANINELGKFSSSSYKGWFDIADNIEGSYYNVELNANNEYVIDNEDKDAPLEAKMIYNNYYASAKTSSGGNAEFSPEGLVSISNNKGQYTISLTSNNDYTNLPWYTVKVGGTECAENPLLTNTGDGYIFEGEELTNISVVANNDEETKVLTFDSDETSVLITNDGDDLVIKEDSDDDGTYDEIIASSDENFVPTTESTTNSTETTTRTRHTGGGSSSSVVTATTTESVTEESSEETTQSAISNVVKATIGDKKIVIGDKTYTIDAAPYIQPSSNSTLVPLRFVALAICGEDVEKADTSSNVKWDAETKTATVSAGSKVIKFTAGSDTMIVDGKSIVMDNGVKAEISNNRMFIPFRALGQALGVSVDWDADTKTAVYNIK